MADVLPLDHPVEAVIHEYLELANQTDAGFSATLIDDARRYGGVCEVLRRNENEDTPGPWIQRAFDALALAQGNAALVERARTALDFLDAALDADHPEGHGCDVCRAADELREVLEPPEHVAPSGVGGTDG